MRVLLASLVVLPVAVAGTGTGTGTGTHAGTGTGAAAAPPRWGRDIRPILSSRCFQCHGADRAARQADLRLDVRESAIADRGGFAAIVPGDPASSELWRRIHHEDPDDVMPPPSAKKPAFSVAELEVLERWIEAGAEYEPHWAFVAPVKPEVPEVEDEGWPRGVLDRFVLARMEAKGVRPSPEADAATLLRRVFLDLTGLPPTVEELDRFEGEPLEDVVDLLFTEEPWRTRVAERLTAPWLDSARYADTNGIHMDAGRQMWLWRDWVIDAFRENMPYDQFVIEQLAGDLLPDATVDQKIASGFNRNHVVTDEGGAIAEEYLVEYAVDRVDTTGEVFLGLTVRCARCHEHKFDPITQKDFYSFLAFFNSIEEPGLYSQTPEDPIRAMEPFISVPTDEQQERLDSLAAEEEDLTRRIEAPLPGEVESRAAFLADAVERSGVHWSVPAVLSAESSDERVALDLQEDGSVLASGPIPEFEDYTFLLETEETDLRLLLLEALAKDDDDPGAGRASHHNAVVSEIVLEARPLGDSGGPDGNWTRVPVIWGWSDHLQMNGDFVPTNVIDPDALGWTLDGPDNAGERDLLLLTEEAFGHEAGTELRVKLAFRSRYSQHSIDRVRFRVSPLADTSLLPVASGRWYSKGPFRPEEDSEDPRLDLYTTAFGGESLVRADWKLELGFADAETVRLEGGLGATYVGRTVYSPDERELELSLGSDDGFQLYVNGEKVAERYVDRGVAPDQDRATVKLARGKNDVVLKIVNTGGPGGFYFAERPAGDVLQDELASALLPEDAVSDQQADEFSHYWRRRAFAAFRELDDRLTEVRAETEEIEKAVPRTMVMKEREEPRETFVLTRGQYDHPDETQPVERATPAFLPPLPEGAPKNRLGLAQWLVEPENPLFARVAVNRFFELLLGLGLVRTSEDFGTQGDWPTHPDLLDWLAVDFRESGWDVRRLLRSIVTSSTYRQSSHVREDLAELDPGNRLLAAYPRRRLSAEQIRDLALYTSGLLVEKAGGPSVKPYQPEGLWKEVAMIQSNTRIFVRGDGEDLWRRSMYTYWKRAVPPPSLQTFDAPTRESCVIRRQSTNTPLQALVLWNDEQFVEAARMLAARILEEANGRHERIVRLFRACTARIPETVEEALIAHTLAEYEGRFEESPEDAEELLAVGEAPVSEGLEPTELAAWTMLANTVLNLHETITQD